ncbi:AfsR/SARP family transcriptional regulator [Actinomadura hibisca]|uniref:AfsR/SARP family transcriptional regulator n=1 Tax=Actinomadura hibisca TaxID=68565 RepID=UPI0008341A71|nr:AfsR/SARP family transcriptional regulator [Actinomadura hibisca]
MAAELTFRLFGPLEVADASGRVLDLGVRKQRALTAMLAAEPGRVVSLDRLVEELWSGEPPAGATRTLQAYVAHLRRVLEPDRAPRTPPRVLLTREPGYLLAVAPGRVDLERFAAGAAEGRQALARGAHREAVGALDRTLALWRGEPLGEFADQEFARPLVARLAELRAVALEDLFEARLAVDEAAVTVPGLESLVAEHPYRERAWRLLVLALYRAGRQADAVGALRRVRERLSGELGLEPGPELRELESAVFAQDPGLGVPPPVAVAPPEPVRPVPGERLVGRDAELEVVERRLAGARRGEGGVLLISGEAGVGKSRLTRSAAGLAAARGFRLAWGRCPDGTCPAFWPWTQILREVTGDAVPLSGGARDGSPPDPGLPDAGAALFELYERVTAALTAGGPLMIVLDDLHWADVSSLRLLSHLADAVTGRPVLVAATLRPEPGARPAALRETLGALARQPHAERIELAPFTAAQVADYLRTRGADAGPERVAALLERTGGNPFYLGEVLRLGDLPDAGGRRVPGGARDVIEQRVARLPEETGALLRAAAVAGREIDAEVVAAVADLPVADVLSALDPAVATGLLVEPPDGPDYVFAHALVQDALYAGLGRARRARLHLRVGHALEPRPDVPPAVLAHHFALAAKVGGAARAAAHAARAARDAADRLACAEAVALLELALAHTPPGDDAARCHLLTELGQARRVVGEPEAAYRALEEAIELAERTGDRPALIAAVAVFGGPALWNWWPYGTVDGRLVAVVEKLLAEPLPDADRALLLGVKGVALVYGPRRREGEDAAAEAVELARRTGDPALRARVLANYLLAAFAPGRNAARLRAAEEMLELPGLQRGAEMVARVSLMACLLRAGDLARWDRELARCERLLEVGRPELEGMVRIAQTARATLDGRWAEAEDLLGRHTVMRFGSALWGREFRTLVTLFAIRRGQGRGAELLDDLVATAEDPAQSPLRPVAVLAAVEAGRPGLARELIGRWGHEVADDWVGDFLVPVWGLVAARLGTPDPAALYERLAPHADLLVVGGMGSACLGSAHQVLAELAHRLGDSVRAHAHARAALDVHRRLGLAYWVERSELLIKELA